MEKILIVEDDKKIRKELEEFLNKHGYLAKGLEKFDNTIQDILDENADLILLDINLPYTDGEFVCKEIRKTSNVPIIMVTSRDNEIDELMSLNYGADQYVTKPYNIQILLAKINGLLKRNKNDEKETQKIDCDGFLLNIAERVIEKDDKKIEISSKEKNDKVILYIKDNGIGIKKGEITRLFERGFTGENGRIIVQKGLFFYLITQEKSLDFSEVTRLIFIGPCIFAKRNTHKVRRNL